MNLRYNLKMKNLVWLLVAVVIMSCTSETKDYASINGMLEVENVTSITVQGKDYTKEISVASDGKFSDTLHVTEGMYMMVVGEERASLFLKDGYDLELLFAKASEATPASVIFKGTGAETNNFIEEKRSFFISDYADPNSYFKLDQEGFDQRLKEAKEKLNKTSIDVKKVDTTVVAMVTGSDERLFSYIESNYTKMRESVVKLAKGKSSPAFSNYENFKGGTTSLSDLKGKYVYLDIWATWCGPCKREIPHLKNLEKDFHGKNIEFVSISVDNVDGRRGSHESWLKMVEEKQLGGIQLFADKDFKSDFIQAYNINSIPRFILVDPEGNIVEANALRPSNPELRTLFQELGI